MQPLHDANWSLLLLSLFLFPLAPLFFSNCHRWTDRSRWSQQTARVEEVVYALPCFFFFYFIFLPPSHSFYSNLAAFIHQLHHYLSRRDDGLCLDAGWQRSLAPDPPALRTHYVNRPPAPASGRLSLQLLSVVICNVKKSTRLVMQENKVASSVKNTCKNQFATMQTLFDLWHCKVQITWEVLQG